MCPDCHPALFPQEFIERGRNLAGTVYATDISTDPFYDEPEDHHIGRATVYLDPLLYVMYIDEWTPLIDYKVYQYPTALVWGRMQCKRFSSIHCVIYHECVCLLVWLCVWILTVYFYCVLLCVCLTRVNMCDAVCVCVCCLGAL